MSFCKSTGDGTTTLKWRAGVLRVQNKMQQQQQSQQSQHMQGLLESCADMVLQCSDGRVIPCVRFQCMTTCDAIRHVVEDVELRKDAKGRMIVPFPNVDSTDLAMASNVVHGVTAVHQLDEYSTPATLRGLRALGHTSLTNEILERLWAVLSAKDGAHWPDVRPHMCELMHTPSVRLDVVRQLARLCPCWPDFSSKVLGNVTMDVQLATWLLPKLCAFFPAGPVFTRVLGLLPAGVLTPDAVLGLFPASAPACFHPLEAVDVMDALAALFAAREWDKGVLGLLRALMAAMRVFDVAPCVANSLHGTIVQIDRTPTVSVLLAVAERKGPVSRKMAPWLWMTVDWAAGRVDASVQLSKLDDAARRARKCHVRLTAYGTAGDCAEVWYHVPVVHPAVWFRLLDAGRYVAGNPEAFAAAVRAGGLTRLRLDLLYGQHDPLHAPL